LLHYKQVTIKLAGGRIVRTVTAMWFNVKAEEF